MAALCGLFVGQAQAFTVSGGDQWQRDCITQAIQSHPDWLWIDKLNGGVDIVIAPNSYGAQSFPGRIDISTAYSSFLALAQTAIHEWCHQIWFAMDATWQARWYAICPDTYSTTWTLQTREHFAECLRYTLYSSDYAFSPYIQTALTSPTPEEAYQFWCAWRYRAVERSHTATIIRQATVGSCVIVIWRRIPANELGDEHVIRLATTAILAGVLLGAIAVPAQAQETEEAMIDRLFLRPHHSLATGDMVTALARWYGIPPAVTLTIWGAETSMGDPNLGGKLARVYNFGCMRSSSNKNTPWGELASGTVRVAGKSWWVFPSAWAGAAAWGRHCKIGPTSQPGFYRDRLTRTPPDWRGWAEKYYGKNVAGFEKYLANIQKINKRVLEKAHAAGFDW